MDPHPLEHFITAQDSGATFGQAMAELRAGSKTSHWIWFVFPQLAGLGRSSTAQAYAIQDLQHARDYLAHPVLGPRLEQAAQALLDLPGDNPVRVLGPVDAMKLRSSMTLFAQADPGREVFPAVLDRYFAGRPDEATLQLLAPGGAQDAG